MRRFVRKGALIAAGVAIVGGSGVAAGRLRASEQAAPQPPSTTLAVQPQAPSPRIFEYTLDLAGPSDAGTVDVPPGQLLTVKLGHAAMPVRYRVTEERTGGAPARHPQEPVELNSVISPGLVKVPFNCPPAAAAPWQAVLDARDESRVQGALDALKTAAPGPCAQVANDLLGNYLRRHVNRLTMVPAGERHRLKVERLAADGSTVERTWSVTFTAGRGDFAWEYPTEQAWIVAGVVQDVSDLAAFAQTAPAPGRVKVTVPLVSAPDALHVEIPGPGTPGGADLVVSPHVFAPELYADLAGRILQSRGLRAGPDGPGGTILASLTVPDAERLLREARRVSDRLTHAPLDARAHEEAAFLWGVFGLREGTSLWNDVRPALARTTAHLAFARALRGSRPPSREGAWAAVLVSTLAGRSLEAVQRIDALAASAPAEKSWAVALRLRNEGDWRAAPQPRQRTLVEQLEFVRAKSVAVGGLDALADLEAELAPVPDWARILMPQGRSVEEGNRFARSWVPFELRDLALAHGVRTPLRQPSDAAALLSDLDAPIVRRRDAAAAVEVLGPSAWSAAAARHLVAAAQYGNEHLTGGLKLLDEAKAFREAVRPVLLPLPTFAMLDVYWREPKTGPGPSSCAELVRLQSKPMQVTATLWVNVLERVCGPAGMAPARSFFDPPVPTGTTLDAGMRMTQGSLAEGTSDANLKAYRALAPWNSAVVLATLHREFRGAIPTDVLLKEYEPFAEYQVNAGRQVLGLLAKDPAARRRTAERMCALAADHCGALANILVLAGEDDAAAVAYQRSMDRSLDRVGASNEAEWLVSYYEDRKQPDRALAVARQAEAVGSSAGFLVMARLLEKRGRLEEAEQHFRAMSDRYQDERSLQNFYIRARSRPGGDRWASQADAAMKALFPDGMERLPGDLSGPPGLLGAWLTQPSKGLIAAGIRPGDVVVGLDGYRVRDGSHYGDLKALSLASTMKLTVWHDGRYVEVEERRDRINYFRQ